MCSSKEASKDTGNSIPRTEDLFGLAVNASLRIETPAERVNVQIKILEALNKCGLSDYARSLLPGITQQLQELPDVQERNYLLILLIRQECCMQLFDEAEKKLLLLRSGDSHYPNALFDIASALAQSGEIQRALELADEIEDLDDYETILEFCGRYYAGLPRFNEVVLTAAKIESPLICSRLLLSLAAEQWKHGLHNESLLTLRKVQTIADGITEKNIRDDVYLQLIDSFLAVQRVFDALTIGKKITGTEKQVEAFCKTALFLHQSGNVSGAQTALNDAFSAARKVAETFKQVDSLSITGEAFHRIGETETAKEVFRECLSAINTLNNGYSKVRRQIEFAEKMFSLGIVNAAAKVFQTAAAQTSHIEEKTFLLLLLSEIVQKQLEYSLTDNIPQTIQQIRDFRIEGFDAELEEGLYERVVLLADFDYGLAMFRSEKEEVKQDGIKRLCSALDSMPKIPDPLNRTISLLQVAERVHIFNV